MNEIFEKDVAVDRPLVNESKRNSSTFSTGQIPLVGSLALGQRWPVRTQWLQQRPIYLPHRGSV